MLKGLVTEDYRDDACHWAVFYSTSLPSCSRATRTTSITGHCLLQYLWAFILKGLVTEDYPDDACHWAVFYSTSLPSCSRATATTSITGHCFLQYLWAFMLKGLVTEDYRDDVYHWAVFYSTLGLHGQGHVFCNTSWPSRSRDSRDASADVPARVLRLSIETMLEVPTPNLWEGSLSRIVDFGHTVGQELEMKALGADTSLCTARRKRWDRLQARLGFRLSRQTEPALPIAGSEGGAVIALPRTTCALPTCA